ncbi:MAG: hypothetical protein KDA60_15850, partial [Planctomycetales bacterium]|nr:hypothetical protein [Planctomycetales bacterium]
IFQELGGWAEVVSGREYRMARQLGFDGAKIIFNGPYKTDADLTAAITDGALINVNDHDELDRLLHIAQLQREPVTLGLRVSATLPRLGHSRFGFSLENDEAKGAIDKIARSSQVELTALHMHLYADTDDAAIYGHAVDAIGQFLQHNLPDYQRQIQWMNLGGGFPAHIAKPKSREAWDPQPIDVYIGAITDALRQYFPRETTQPTLIVEPGRYLTSDGIVLVTEVVHVKRREGKQVVNSNGSISMVPLTHYCPQIVRAYTRTLVERNATMVPTVIHGATCRENDVLFDGPFPVVSPGDYLITFAAGAYNSSLSPDFIFAAPRMQLI